MSHNSESLRITLAVKKGMWNLERSKITCHGVFYQGTTKGGGHMYYQLWHTKVPSVLCPVLAPMVFILK
jgi:hypothetical protein